MPGYLTKREDVAIAGVADLVMCSLLDRQQFSDPFGAARRQGFSSATWPLFGLLWPSGAQLAARLGARAVQPGEKLLEVGCGLALASLVSHRRGGDVTASDCHPLTRAFLAENLRLNHLAPMKYRHGHWGGTPPDGPAAGDSAVVQGRFDLIFGSDLLYDRDAGVALAGFIERHAAPRSEVWIVDPDRGNRPVFNRLMRAHGFEVGEERLDSRSDSRGEARLGALGAPLYKGRLLSYRRT
jgi:predicted nicotinamide N-methyase